MKKTGTSIELNPEFKHALKIMEKTSGNVFVTGKAGTGKSTLLRHFCETTTKKTAVIAPTGVAALNVKGQTIHSFCRFKPNITPEQVRRLRFASDKKNIYKKLDAIIIDEISMVRADLLDCVDRFLRLNGPDIEKPFGGIQMVFIGDLYQLPPVITGKERETYFLLYDSPYFYSSRVFETLDMELIELQKVYRQHDREFITILNAIRNRTADDSELQVINQRYQPDFDPPPGDMYIHLSTTNAIAEKINSSRLEKLTETPFEFDAVKEGKFGSEYMPTAEKLRLKTGAQVMMLNNDREGRWVNGTLAEVTDINCNSKGEYVIRIEMEDGGWADVAPFTWEIYNYKVDDGQLKTEVVGSFTQYPLMLAWAVTIHKGQGKTFNKVVIDLGRGAFAHGQSYVALSRCTTLDGIILKKLLRRSDILVDNSVISFLESYKHSPGSQPMKKDAKTALLSRAIREKTPVEMIYLKPNGEKTTRLVIPKELGKMTYRKSTYPGLKAFCMLRNQERTFRLDRIMDIREPD